MPDAQLTSRIETLDGTEHVLSISTDLYAWMVRLDVLPDVGVEDNYFDLLPGEVRRVGLKGEPVKIAETRAAVLHSAF